MRSRTKQLLDAVHYIADVQQGLIAAHQLTEIGFDGSARARRTRTGGGWRRVLPGIYSVTSHELTIERREYAGILFAGADAQLTGSSALRRHGLKYLPQNRLNGLVHVAIPIHRHRKSAGFVVVERTKRLPRPTTLGGVECAPVARAVVDAGRRTTSRTETRAMLLEAVQRGLTTTDLLSQELRRSQRRGTALLSEALAEAKGGVRSAPEAELREHIQQTDVPEPVWNPTLLMPDGTFLASPDALIQESMVAIEVDSEEHHSEGAGWDVTLERHTNMTVAGLIVVHVIPGKFRANPTQYLSKIKLAHEQGVNRPLPNIQVKLLDERGVLSV
jgi:hypothetical protein